LAAVAVAAGGHWSWKLWAQGHAGSPASTGARCQLEACAKATKAERAFAGGQQRETDRQTDRQTGTSREYEWEKTLERHAHWVSLAGTRRFALVCMLSLRMCVRAYAAASLCVTLSGGGGEFEHVCALR